MAEKVVSDPFLKIKIKEYLWINRLKFYSVCFYCITKSRITKIYGDKPFAFTSSPCFNFYTIFKEEQNKNSSRYSYVLTRVKKYKMLASAWMYKSSIQEFKYNNISCNNNNVIITISGHIEKHDTIKTVYSGIFRHNQGYLAIFSHVQTY